MLKFLQFYTIVDFASVINGRAANIHKAIDRPNKTCPSYFLAPQIVVVRNKPATINVLLVFLVQDSSMWSTLTTD